MGRHQREKGKRVERAAATRLRKLFKIDARRSVQYCGKAGDADLVTVPGLHVEVKGRKTLSAVRFLDQAKDDAKPGDVPIVLMKEDRGTFLVLLELDDLPELLELLGAKGKV